MQFIDSHSHIYLEDFDSDRDQVVQRALDASVKKILLPNIDRDSIKPMLKLCDRYPDICFPMMGLHPSYIKENYEDELAFIEEHLKSGNYLAIGEIGIDLYWDKTFRKEQMNAFRTQLRWAKELKLPVVIHTRDAFDEVYGIVLDEKNEDLQGVFHCFSGTNHQAKQIVNLGFYLGIGGVLTFKNSNLDNAIYDIDPNHILLETDSPFLPPVPYRGKRNESAYLMKTADKLADVLGIALDELAAITTRNTENLFRLNHHGKQK